MAEDQPYFLYVEDDISSREVMEVLLKDVMGFTEVVVFETSSNFMERLNHLPVVPDVIFLDIHIKPQDGYELFRMIQEDQKFKKSILVALTASVMSNEVEKLRAMGFKNLIGKPINPMTFPEKLTTILAGEAVWDVSWD
jgi:CheY-like chemotaxis protein